MYHAQLALGASMATVDGWQLPKDYGDASQEAAQLRETVGVSDISPVGKLRVVGAGAAGAVGTLIPRLVGLAPGSVAEVDSLSEQENGELLAAWLTADELLVLTPPGQAQAALDAMPNLNAICAHVVDITSGLCGVSIIGPASTRLLSRITDLNISPRAMPDLTCAQARVAEVQGLLLRRGHPKHTRLPTLRRQRVRRVPLGSPDRRGNGNRRQSRGNRSACQVQKWKLTTDSRWDTEFFRYWVAAHGRFKQRHRRRYSAGHN